MPIAAHSTAESRQDSAPGHRNPSQGAPDPETALTVLRAAQRAGELAHSKYIPGQEGRSTSWPESVHPAVAAAFAARGIATPWTHQAQAAGLALAGRNV